MSDVPEGDSPCTPCSGLKLLSQRRTDLSRGVTALTTSPRSCLTAVTWRERPREGTGSVKDRVLLKSRQDPVRWAHQMWSLYWRLDRARRRRQVVQKPF